MKKIHKRNKIAIIVLRFGDQMTCRLQEKRPCWRRAMCYLLDLLVQVNIRRPGCHCCRLTIQCCIYKQAKHSSPKHLQVSCRYLSPCLTPLASLQLATSEKMLNQSLNVYYRYFVPKNRMHCIDVPSYRHAIMMWTRLKGGLSLLTRLTR